MTIGMITRSVDTMLNTAEVAAAAGVTIRQLDHLTREGVITPTVIAAGSGSSRRWAQRQVRVLRLIAVLRGHGASYSTLRNVVSSAEALDDGAWGARVLVTLDGRITTLLGADSNGWLIDLTLCREALPGTRVLTSA